MKASDCEMTCKEEMASGWYVSWRLHPSKEGGAFRYFFAE